MSGLEVVGVVLGVLGALPAAVEALKGYRTLLSSVRNVERELRTIIQDLETERVRLRTTCEILLDGVAPYSLIDSLIERPFGPDWKPYKDQLRLRLWSSTTNFEEYVLEMQNASIELSQKLSIQADGKTNLKDRSTILKELKRGASFTLRKKDYEDIIERIKNGNSILHDLVNQSCGLEPSRQQRSQARLIKLIRGLARSLFQAIQNATTCRCLKPYEVCLELVPRKALILPGDLEDNIAKDFVFHVAFGNHKTFPADETGRTSDLTKARRWEKFDLRLGDFTTKPLSIPENTCPIVATPASKSQRKVAWSQATNTSTTLTTQTLLESSKVVTSLPPAATQSNRPLPDICLDLSKPQGTRVTNCHGYINDTDREFGLYPPKEVREIHDTITLRQLLSKNEQFNWEFDCIQKLKVALAITTNILHLYKTPWLGRTVTLDDFVFFREDASLLSGPDTLDRPFIAKGITNSQDASVVSKFKPVNLMVLSLGLLLTQIIIGSTVEELDVKDTVDMNMNTIVSKYEMGNSFSDRVLENGGLSYAAVVKWCLSNVFSLANLENENFCQTFYNEVVARIEEDVGYLEAGTL